MTPGDIPITAVLTSPGGEPVSDELVVIFFSNEGNLSSVHTTPINGIATTSLTLTVDDIASVHAKCGSRVSNNITITCEPAAYITLVDFDETIVGTTDYTRFAGRIDVDNTVGFSDYDAYYIFEITDGEINGVPEYYDNSSSTWQPFSDLGNKKYRFGPSTGFDLLMVDGSETQFQIEITNSSITGKAYLVNASDGMTILSNVIEETISAD